MAKCPFGTRGLGGGASINDEGEVKGSLIVSQPQGTPPNEWKATGLVVKAPGTPGNYIVVKAYEVCAK